MSHKQVGEVKPQAETRLELGCMTLMYTYIDNNLRPKTEHSGFTKLIPPHKKLQFP